MWIAVLTVISHYVEMSGTSMAAGIVSGSVAAMLAKDPSLNPATIKARLMRSARKIQGDAVDTGAGVLDVAAAMNDTSQISGEALSPRIAQSGDGSEVLVEDTAALWGLCAVLGKLYLGGGLWLERSNQRQRTGGIPGDGERYLDCGPGSDRTERRR